MSRDATIPAGAGGRVATLDACFTLPRFALFLLAALFAAFPTVWLGAESFFRSDYGVLAYPFVHYHRESIWSGELPLWNPLSNCGAPFLAQWGTMVLYPGTLFYVLLPLPWSLGVFCLLHLWLGGIGMFKLAERWTHSRFGAAVAGTVFVFNGITLACLIWPNYTVALGWMPWVVLLVQRAWKEGGRTVVLAALAASMQMLAGTPEIVVFTWIVLGGLLSVESVERKTEDGSRVPVTHYGLRFALILALVSALCAAQLLPFFDLLTHSQRDPSQAVGKWALPAWGWANLLVPMFRCAMSPQEFYFMQGQEFLTSCYAGAAALALAALAVWRVRDRRVVLLAVLGVVAVLLAMGNNGPLFPLLHKVIPVVGIARYLVKFLILVAFVVSLLAAFGVKWCLSRDGASDATASGPWAIGHRPSATEWQPLLVLATLVPAIALLVLWWMRGHPLTYDRFDETVANTVGRMLFFGCSLAMLFNACAGPRQRTSLLAGLATLALIAADGLTHLKNQNPTLDAKLFAPNLGREATGIALRPGDGRLMISPDAERTLLHIGATNWAQEFALKRRAFWSNLNALDGVPKVNGSSTLRIREQDELQSWIYASNAAPSEALLNFLGVGNVLTGMTNLAGVSRPSSLPFITAGQRPLFGEKRESSATLQLLFSGLFDPRGQVHLPAEYRSKVAVTGPSLASLREQSWSANRVECEVTADVPALVAIAQTFYHPWKAYVDDKPVPLLRANHAFQALEVPAGTHRVRLAYEDRKFRIGCLISLAALAVCGVMWRRGKRLTHGQ